MGISTGMSVSVPYAAEEADFIRSQIYFTDLIVTPLWESLSVLLPSVECLVENAKANSKRYREASEALVADTEHLSDDDSDIETDPNSLELNRSSALESENLDSTLN